MSSFKVSREKIKLFDHPNADLLQIGKVGVCQVVVQKGLYKDDDVVVFAPEKSILTGTIRDEYDKYLAGDAKNRVKAVRLRGQLSCGIIIPQELLPELTSEIGEDISALLGITKYRPVIPKELDGDAEAVVIDHYHKHDCEQYLVYEDNFVADERVVVTEKVHGVQSSIVSNGSRVKGNIQIMSKGLADDDIMFSITPENMGNMHLRAVFSEDLEPHMLALLEANFGVSSEDHLLNTVQVIGEIVPSQKSYNYGQEKPTIRIFKMLLTKGDDVPVVLQYDQVPDFFRKLWVPVLYDGPFSRAAVVPLCEGKEQVSGKELHIREGAVVCPYVARRASDGTHLVVKIINPKYKETGDELS